MDNELPPWINDMIAAGPPAAGTGVNNWCYRMARVLHEFRSKEDIYRLIDAATYGCGRSVSDKEIRRAVENSYANRYIPGKVNVAFRESKWPPLNEGLRRDIISAGHDLSGLLEDSPLILDDATPEDVVKILFPVSTDPWLCCAKSKSDFRTLKWSVWEGRLANMCLIVPSPMTQKHGVTKEGRKSEHTLDNTGARRFLVVEFDNGTLDEHAAVIRFLAKKAPLAMVLHSGGKSLHAWFYCKDRPEDALHKFMSLAISIGACTSTWARLQFVRLPMGIRPETGKKQEVYYLNPMVINDYASK